MQISQSKVVQIHYTLSDDAGEVLDRSGDGAPLVYLHGAGNIIPGLESALDGRSPGDSFNVVVPAAQAYGEHHEQLVQEVPRAAFGEAAELKSGMRFQAQTDQGQVSVMITAVGGESVTVDGNHPLAGQQLSFEIEVVDVREAMDEEIAHGHPHGADGNETH